MSNSVIPFGKYKGQEIESVAMRDPAYLQWLMQQAWFSEKFRPVYQLVVNNFSPATSDETPAHNALQVQFLEHCYITAFYRSLGGIEKTLVNLLNRYRRDARLPSVPRLLYWQRRDKSAREQHRAMIKRRWDDREQYRKKLRVIHGDDDPPHIRLTFGPPIFEDVTDVVFDVRIAVGMTISDAVDCEQQICVEIKPSMGDDYPAVLRQIKRQQQAAEYNYRRRWVLLVDQFASNVVTFDQVKCIFENSDIEMITVADVRAELIRRRQQEGGGDDK